MLDTQGYTHTHTHTHTLRICNTLLFHGNNGCTKAPQYYFLYTLRVLLHVTVGCICHCALEGEVFQQSVFLHEAVMTHDKSNRYNGEGQNSNWRLPYASYVRAQRSFDPIPLTLRLLMSYIYIYIYIWSGPPLWSSGQCFWLQIQRSRVRFPALSDFLSSSGSGTGSTQPREINWGATWIKK